MISPKQWLETSDHVGHLCPYYRHGNTSELYTHIGADLGTLPAEEKRIDPVAILEYLTKSHILADRTMVQHICRTPWRAKPTHDGWDYAPIPQHGSCRIPAEEVARELRKRLLHETRGYVLDKKRIGILLSGGMDSRVLAGIVRDIQLRGEWNGQVIAFTWGVDGSRDVEYARRISDRFSWEWLHLRLTPETLYNNFFIAADMGAEFAPYHLHAMQRVVDYEGELDAVLAATYGDSIGRGEFSGTHLRNLRSILEGRSFRLIRRRDFWLVLSEVYGSVKHGVVKDVYEYRNLVKMDGQEHNLVEIELMMHYLRRKLMSAMSYVGIHIPLYQIFTHPRVFSFMWSLDPDVRTDDIYRELLGILPGNLHTIPWARTGKVFGSSAGDSDRYSKDHHQYGIWLRRDLRQFIESHVLSETVRSLNMFNERLLKSLLSIWSKARAKSVNKIDEILSWLTSFCIFVEKYRLLSPYDTDVRNVKDTLGYLCGAVTARLYQEATGALHE